MIPDSGMIARPVGARRLARLSLILLALAGRPLLVRADDLPQQRTPSPQFLSDRGPGLATSLFGTYVRKGEWLVYTFYEYTRNAEFEYKPSELGFTGDEDFLGTLRESEDLLFVSYGLTDRVAFELEGAARARATLDKSPQDPSGVPKTLTESGLGDVQGELRWRWSAEGEHRPEYFSWFEVGFPFQRNRVLLGTQDWEYTLGFGAIKGHRWGTLTGRVSIAYDGSDGTIDAGEYAVEYLKRVSKVWRFVGAVEGESDEVNLVVEAQAQLGRHLLLKFNSGFGVTTKAPDVAPEVGLLFSW
jgi:hypothetical protein